LILIPMRSMGKISSVVIADAWKQNNRNLIADIYKKSSISLSVIGFLLLIGLWSNIDNIFMLIGDKYLPGKYVILLLGLANMTDIALGVSPHIILNSSRYKYLSYFLLIFVVLLVVTNLIFIPIFGLLGAAIASLLSKVIYNLIKFLFLYKEWKLQPFDTKYLYLVVISLVVYGLSCLIPSLSNYIFDIGVRSLSILLVFTILVYYTRISGDINQRIDSLIKLIVRKIG